MALIVAIIFGILALAADGSNGLVFAVLAGAALIHAAIERLSDRLGGGDQ